MDKFYVGLDVHGKDCVYAVQDEHGTLIGEGSVSTHPRDSCCFANASVCPGAPWWGWRPGRCRSMSRACCSASGWLRWWDARRDGETGCHGSDPGLKRETA